MQSFVDGMHLVCGRRETELILLQLYTSCSEIEGGDTDVEVRAWANEEKEGRRRRMDTALESILEVALQQGIWAALYIYLFFRMLKENAQREEKYQQMIDTLSKNIQTGIDNIQNRLDDMAGAGKQQSA